VRALRLLSLPILIAAATAYPAQALFSSKSVTGQMDSDPAPEQVKAVELPNATDPTNHDLSQTVVDVVDDCHSGKVEQRVAGPQDALVTLKLVNADTRPGKEALIDMRSGASGRFGELRVVSLRRAPAGSGVCEQAHYDFLYLSTHPTPHPRGANGLTDFELTVRNFSRRYRGSELRLVEGWAKPSDALCCPTFEKTTFYRYDRRKDRYVRYASKVTRNRRH
jgi:hypothetical protein